MEKVESSKTFIQEIDCISILQYLENNAGAEYTSPDKVDEEEREKLLKIKELGSYATTELQKMAKLCEADLGLKSKGKSKWLDGSNTKIRSYLWEQMKSPKFEKSPSSISVFAEKRPGENARFKFSIELDEANSEQVDYESHHNILNKSLKNDVGLFYLINEKEVSDSNEIVAERVRNGSYKKVEIAYILSMDEIAERNYDNEMIIKKMRLAMKELKGYYQLILDSYNPVNESVDKPKVDSNNLILYGPPGTGKTYNTVNYAVSIIENKALETVKSENYESVFKRYLVYKEKGKVGFVTFHQSYGYEEFIEGIKPVMNDDSEQVHYQIESGVFKDFCENVQQLKVIDNGEEYVEYSTVWKISLHGSGENWLKDECFERNQIRIDFSNYPKDFYDEKEGENVYEDNSLYYFYEEMSIGDIVLSLGDHKHIDAIGIITGEPTWLDSEDSFKRCREVKWIVTDIFESIYELNGRKNMSQKTIYQLNRISMDDINKIILKYSHTNQVDIQENNENYVFIIDEINRGNISKIFGELITLIEPTKRIGASEETKVKLPYSKKSFGVPQNVHIIGTMNTADRSIALLDTALRRRFHFIEMMPDVRVLNDIFVESINIAKMLDIMNKRIELLYDREHTIGQAYFMRLRDNSTIKELSSIFQSAIIPLLQEYFYEDYYKIQLILGDNAKEQSNRFILDTHIQLRDIFKGNPDIITPEQSYQIQISAFDKEDSYKGIYE